MSEKALEILNLAFKAYENNEDTLKLKMPEGSKIHEFNMALKELNEEELITIVKKNMTLAEIMITEKALEKML